MLLPIQPSHGTVWLEDDTGRVARKVRARQSRNGSLQQLLPDSLAAFDPKRYHQAQFNEGSIALYAPRSAWAVIAGPGRSGFPFLPATSTDFWAIDVRRHLLTRYRGARTTCLMSGKPSLLTRDCSPMLQRCNKFEPPGKSALSLARRRPPKQPPLPFTGRAVFLLTAPDFDEVATLVSDPLLSMGAHAWARGRMIVVKAGLLVTMTAQHRRWKFPG